MNTDTSIKRTVISREGVGTTASILTRNDLFIGKFVTDYPTFILVKRGKKTLYSGERRVALLPGDAVAIAAGAACDVQNETDEGLFEADWIVCARNIICGIEPRFPKHKKVQSIVSLQGLGKEFALTFERGLQAIKEPQATPDLVAEHRVCELLQWLANAGYVFRSNERADIQRKVRLLIGAEPDKKWSSQDIAESLALSEATLRRKLAKEGNAFSEILVDVRMSLALSLLQSTDAAIASIAYQVGYESASRFSVRFKQRFGFSPTAIRNGKATGQGSL
ncbi:AraC-type DNA-binding domain-containing protein [Hahella chejuensis KCTC 2396]|uniref:AraC-type DNA-binding domain-containing protein n=1 Tax=Hahella chejuensis (strain KCTC 2396) TaxID=349521 RepID=Q2S8T9_HAHCH|nr:AraC family transcriptional regulator [Hahella chejuensis]ABC32935.1 AraC-type DNA-binding domain-containing protein [Hahella chejuensis KCTC 2396]